MTIRFISIFSLSVFHWYKRKSCWNTNIEGYFHFSSKWSLFSKIIVSSGHFKFFREVFSVFEKCQFLVALFPFGKKCHFMQKVLFFGQMSEFLSTVIKSCRANFGVKWRVFFSTSIFVQKCQFWGKKIKFREKCWFFQTIVHYYWKWTYWKTCLFSENCDFLCDCLYTSRNCRILIKTSIFLRKFLFVHVLIFIKVFYLWKIVILIQNIISFGDILDKSVISW